MADDELRRRERLARVAPGDPEAQARLAAARSRVGETPLLERALEALERAALAQQEPGQRATALSEVARGLARFGQGARAAALASVAHTDAEGAGPARGARALASAGAALACTGRRPEGLALLARAAASPRIQEHAFSLLVSCGDAGLDARELRETVPGVEGLARAHGGRWDLADLTPHLERWGLLGRVTAALEEALEREELYGRNQALERLTALGALTPALASGFVERLLSEPAGGDPFDDPIDSLSTGALATALRVAGLDPASTLEPCVARLAAAGRHPAALTLRLVLLRARARGSDPRLTAEDYRRALQDAAGLGANARRPPRRPSGTLVDPGPAAMASTRVLCDGLAACSTAEPLPGAARAELLSLGLDLAPEAIYPRCEVIGAVAAGAARLGPAGHLLLRRAALAGLQLLATPASWSHPRWLAFEALELCAEAAPELQDGSSLLGEIAPVAVAGPQALGRRANPTTVRFFSARALLTCACAAHILGAEAQAADWRARALDQLGAQSGQDLADGLQHAARALARQRDPVWRAEGLLGLAEACARAPLPDPNPKETFALLVALLDPP